MAFFFVLCRPRRLQRHGRTTRPLLTVKLKNVQPEQLQPSLALFSFTFMWLYLFVAEAAWQRQSRPGTWHLFCLSSRTEGLAENGPNREFRNRWCECFGGGRRKEEGTQAHLERLAGYGSELQTNRVGGRATKLAFLSSCRTWECHMPCDGVFFPLRTMLVSGWGFPSFLAWRISSHSQNDRAVQQS